VSILIIVTQTDLDERIIPDKVVASGVIGTVGLRFWSHPLPWWDYAAAALLGSGVLLFAGILGEKLLKREAMGGGDIKLYVFIGLVLGMQATAVSLLFASLSGVVFGLFWRIKKGNEPIPFGPFIAAGALCAYLWGNPLVEWYARLLA
jgi:leader peptidase (prepilin peptidase)/N-methyltransferase